VIAACSCGSARAVVAYAGALLREVDEGLMENRLWIEPREVFARFKAAAIASSSESLAWYFVEAERDLNLLVGDDAAIVVFAKGSGTDAAVLGCWRAWSRWTLKLQQARDLADREFVVPADVARDLLASQPELWFPHAFPCCELNARGGAA